MKEALFGKTLDELTTIARDLNLPAYTGKQLCEWLYKKDISSMEEMTNVSKKARAQLSSSYFLGLQAPVNVQTSVDGTKKYLFSTQSGKFIETAFIPEKNRNTVCVFRSQGRGQIIAV